VIVFLLILLFGKFSANKLVKPNLNELLSVPPSNETEHHKLPKPQLKLIVLPATHELLFQKFQLIVLSSIGN
jgi:hypothetical protein